MPIHMLRRAMPGTAALAAMLLLAACAAPRTLSQAQDSFSAGARIENQSALQTSTAPVPVPARSLALGHYRDTDATLSQLLGNRDAEAALRKDQLLGNAVLLRALTAWRIQALTSQAAAARETTPAGAAARCTDARGDAEGAFTALANQGADVALGPRDAFLVGILPALRENSWSHCIVSTRAIDDASTHADVHRRQRDSFELIEGRLRDTAPQGGAAVAGGETAGLMLDPGVRRYARFAQMQMLVNWQEVLLRQQPDAAKFGCISRFIDGRLWSVRSALQPVTDPAERAVLDEQLRQLGRRDWLNAPPAAPPAPSPNAAACPLS